MTAHDPIAIALRVATAIEFVELARAEEEVSP
jgi:hypothetical protein